MAATIIFPSIMPFTILLMKPINDKLMEKAQSLMSSSLEDKGVEAGVASGENVHALIDKWAALDKREAAGANSFGFTTGANRIS
jgi:hypothetical protein